MSLQKTFLWPHSKNPGETFEGWATESRQLSASLRQMLARRISASGGGSWPTPTANAWTGAGHQGRQGGLNLQTAVARVPTPAARDWRSGKGRKDNGHTPQLPEVVGGQLNPTWVEWLMAWPIGWTDCEPLATDRCRWPQRPLGAT
jgi:hypothetical protein